jgi:hypothetical protein
MRQAIGLAGYNRITAKDKAIFLGIASWPATFASGPFQLAQFKAQRQIFSHLRHGDFWLFNLWPANWRWALWEAHPVGFASNRVARYAKCLANLRNGQALRPQLFQLFKTFISPNICCIGHSLPHFPMIAPTIAPTDAFLQHRLVIAVWPNELNDRIGYLAITPR